MASKTQTQPVVAPVAEAVTLESLRGAYEQRNAVTLYNHILSAFTLPENATEEQKAEYEAQAIAALQAIATSPTLENVKTWRGQQAEYDAQISAMETALAQYQSMMAVENEAVHKAANDYIEALGFTSDPEANKAKIAEQYDGLEKLGDPDLRGKLWESRVIAALQSEIDSVFPSTKNSPVARATSTRAQATGTKLVTGNYSVLAAGSTNPLTGNTVRHNMFNSSDLRLVVKDDKVQIWTGGDKPSATVENKYTLDKLAKEYLIPLCGGGANSKISGADMAQHFGHNLIDMQE